MGNSKNNPQFFREEVPLSKILYEYDYVISRDLKNINELRLPVLKKNQYGEYTIWDGRHRIFLAARGVSSSDLRDGRIFAEVINVKSEGHFKGKYVWQIVHTQDEEKKKGIFEKVFDKMKYKKMDLTFLPYLEKKIVRSLDKKTIKLLRRIGYVLKALYGDYEKRINDLLVIANIEDFALSHASEVETIRNQLKLLRQYERKLSELIEKDILEETEALSLLEQLLKQINLELQGSLALESKKHLERLRRDLIGKEKNDLGLINIFKYQLKIIRSGQPLTEEEILKLRKCIIEEKRFYDSIKYMPWV